MSTETGSKSTGTVFISAGEQSGDMHASSLMKELNRLSETPLSFSGLGGEMMKAEGLEPMYHVKDLATVGFVDVLKKYSFFKKAIRDASDFIRLNSPEVVILVDYPGFNLRLAEEIRGFYKKKIIYYISPQLWAWHEKRVFKIKKYIDLMLVVFPFEVDFYSRYNVYAEFTGHPLVKRIDEYISSHPVKPRDKKTITILPGSRKDEVKNHMPVLIQTIKEIRKNIDVSININIAPGLESAFNDFREELKDYNLTGEKTYDLILNSDLVLAKAGTSTMECALLGTPYLIFYKTFPLNYYLLKPVVKIDKLGIVNILLGESVIKEFIQNDFTSGNLCSEALKLLRDIQYRQVMIENFRKVKNILGSKDASTEAAKLIINTALL
ncbi:MAG TPA: lipid-A-disaccharide synthase [Ignavibacteria bacterium]|nr:lipid-A-disaccharide synthase [Bacteroidota bacterium]HRE11878.1 lipid-A-disaccharide synthase [Ignavibacteria bacterium]HRF64993.1 lipid-A-disaccharide synthase [Ignavibacteria bacterium]HRJ03420.1 lipid-A-disaccharide synthase [Ignavibacteria bacterium]HRJ85521.1 lipid-A-disaccharide synthase [Ignavibacteria bacterium]